MITAIFIIVFASAILADFFAYRRFVRQWQSKILRCATVSFFAVTDLLPLFVIAFANGLFLCDNTQLFSDASMWTTTLWFLSVLPRLAFYVGLFAIRNRTLARIVAFVLSVSVFCLLLTGTVKTRTDIAVKTAKLHYADLPASFDGYRIAFISDLHIGAMLDAPGFCTKIVDTFNSLHPDMVVFGGDLVNIRHAELTPRIERILSNIKATDGVVAVLGNHDTGIYIKDTVALPRAENIARVCASVRKIGWRLLRDSTIYVHRGNAAISVTGIDFSDTLLTLRRKFSFSADEYDLTRIYAGVSDSLFNITVSHLPQLWHGIVKEGYGDLTLSGHVHAAQMKAECGSVRLSPAMLMYREWSGLYEEDHRRLYINDGIGTVGFYMRIGAKPEITLMELCN